jgi:hypothetical protein
VQTDRAQRSDLYDIEFGRRFSPARYAGSTHRENGPHRSRDRTRTRVELALRSLPASRARWIHGFGGISRIIQIIPSRKRSPRTAPTATGHTDGLGLGMVVQHAC